MMKKKRSHATVCVVLGGKTVVEVIHICKSYLSYFCAFSEDLCYINFSLSNSPVIPVFIIADVPEWRSLYPGGDHLWLLPLLSLVGSLPGDWSLALFLEFCCPPCQ